MPRRGTRSIGLHRRGVENVGGGVLHDLPAGRDGDDDPGTRGVIGEQVAAHIGTGDNSQEKLPTPTIAPVEQKAKTEE